jgi:hypothetical protein
MERGKRATLSPPIPDLAGLTLERAGSTLSSRSF